MSKIKLITDRITKKAIQEKIQELEKQKTLRLMSDCILQPDKIFSGTQTVVQRLEEIEKQLQLLRGKNG